MTHTRHLVLLATFALAALVHVPTARGAMTAQVTAGNVVLLTGDGANDHIKIEDGYYAPPDDDYAVSMYIPEGGQVTPGPGCIQGGPPVIRTYCGDRTANRMEINLGGGNDNVEGSTDTWDELEEIVVDLGSGDDESGGGMVGLRMTVSGGDGTDDIRGDTRAATLDGGPGNDYVQGGGAGDTLRGGPGDDEILGLSGDDRIYGEDGGDSLLGGDNNDTIEGGAGLDNVQGDASSNVGQGNDTILVDDGERDNVDCGAGADSVSADALDVIDSVGCESVSRSGAGGPAPGPGVNPGFRPGPGSDLKAPTFTTAPKLTRSAFRAATSGAMIAQATRGTTLSLSLSEAARLRFTVRRQVAGRRVRGRCVARRPSNRRRPRCTRQVQAGGTVTKSVAAGVSRLRFTGRAGGRRLRPGRYVLAIVAVDPAGNTSRTATVRFRIIR